MTDMHDLVRTSPKGGEFIGTCMKCGKEGLRLSAMREECPNPSGMTQKQALMTAIKGENS